MNVYIKDSQQPAQACIIWMHGLGADAQDMAGLAEQLPLHIPIRHLFLDAPVRPVTMNNGMAMRAWYDILSLKLTDREDREGVLQAETLIHQVIASQLSEGFTSNQLFLAGFSQGGAMALFTGLRSKMPLGGIVSLSSYLPLASECSPVLERNTPFFIGSGLHDPLVLPLWTRESVKWIKEQGFSQVVAHEYPMEHSICYEEINDIAQWLTKQITAITQQEGA